MPSTPGPLWPSPAFEALPPGARSCCSSQHQAPRHRAPVQTDISRNPKATNWTRGSVQVFISPSPFCHSPLLQGWPRGMPSRGSCPFALHRSSRMSYYRMPSMNRNLFRILCYFRSLTHKPSCDWHPSTALRPWRSSDTFPASTPDSVQMIRLRLPRESY